MDHTREYLRVGVCAYFGTSMFGRENVFASYQTKKNQQKTSLAPVVHNMQYVIKFKEHHRKAAVMMQCKKKQKTHLYLHQPPPPQWARPVVLSLRCFSLPPSEDSPPHTQLRSDPLSLASAAHKHTGIYVPLHGLLREMDVIHTEP